MQRMLATAADAEIILKLYELRTETVMRQARAWVGGEFWPQTVEEFYAVFENPRDPHNPWLRQVLTYWEMGAAMVLHGAVSAELVEGELWQQFHRHQGKIDVGPHAGGGLDDPQQSAPRLRRVERGQVFDCERP